MSVLWDRWWYSATIESVNIVSKLGYNFDVGLKK